MSDVVKLNRIQIVLGEQKNACFVIMPFGATLDRVYEKVFRPAIQASRLTPLRGDELYGHRRIMGDIWESIRTSRCILAELTGKNANVLYELGLSHAIGKPVVIVTSDINDVPFDLRDLRCIVYDKNHPDWGELLKSDITSAIQSVLNAHDPSELLRDIEISAKFPDLPDATQILTENQKTQLAKWNVSGEWQLEETYDGGTTTGVVELRQNGSEVQGSFVITDLPEDDDEFIIKESVSGFVKGDNISLSGTSFQVIKGETDSYQLDRWQGKVTDNNTIVGKSTDEFKTKGQFKLKRVQR